MPRKCLVSVWRAADPSDRRLVRSSTWKQLISDVIEEYELKNPIIKVYLPDGLTELKEKFFDAAMEDGMDSLVVHWEGDEPPSLRTKSDIANNLEAFSDVAISPLASSSMSGPSTSTYQPCQKPHAELAQFTTIPIPYKLPQFSNQLLELLQAKKEKTKTAEKITNCIVKILRDDMLHHLGNSVYPTRDQYTEVCLSLIRKFPYLADNSASGTGIDIWKQKLRRSFRTLRDRAEPSPEMLAKKRLFDGTASRAGKSASVVSIHKSPSKKKRSEISDDIPEVSDLHQQLRDETSQPMPDCEKIASLLLTFRPQRKASFINSPNVLGELETWKAFDIPTVLYHEVLSELGRPSLASRFERDMSCMLQRIHPELLKKLAKNKAFEELITRYDDDVELLCFLGLGVAFREDLRFFFTDVTTLSTKADDVSRQLLIVVDQTADTRSFGLALDRVLFRSGMGSVRQALCSAFCLHYVFDIGFAVDSIYNVILFLITGDLPKSRSASNFIKKYSLSKF